jgi:hypothetical protein
MESGIFGKKAVPVESIDHLSLLKGHLLIMK